MPRRPVVLLVEDDEAISMPLSGFLSRNGFDVEPAGNVAAALEAFRRAPPDAAIVDFSLPDGDGLDLLGRLKELEPLLPVILLTGHGTIDLAVKAMKDGAEQFFTKPVELATLKVVIERALQNQRDRKASLVGKSSKARTAVDPFLGEHPSMQRLAAEATRVAGVALPVLIRGETGSGKGLLARWLHDNGPRAEEPFVEINCAGLSKELLESELFGHEKGAFTGAVSAKAGLLELAHRGTLFLDEIGEIDLQVQAKLLKVLEDLRFRRLGDVRDRQVDVRLVAATHRDVLQLVQEQRFREDLYYRINTLPLHVPPLRDRGDDVVRLARRLLERVGAELGRPGVRLSPEAEAAVLRHPWPGNVRQLRNVLERAALLADSDVLGPEMLEGPAGPSPSPAASAPRLTLEEAEKVHIQSVLDAEAGVVPKAAEVLGLSRSALYAKLKKHRIGKR
jgi:DNA-binding NtrC family response regulator